jgi:hypothetical protein
LSSSSVARTALDITPLVLRCNTVRALVAVIAAMSANCGGNTEPCNCRGDETCVEETCIPWADAPLSVDFTVTVEGMTATCEVLPDGFPRERVEALRFAFGDGFSCPRCAPRNTMQSRSLASPPIGSASAWAGSARPCSGVSSTGWSANSMPLHTPARKRR